MMFLRVNTKACLIRKTTGNVQPVLICMWKKYGHLFNLFVFDLVKAKLCQVQGQAVRIAALVNSLPLHQQIGYFCEAKTTSSHSFLETWCRWYDIQNNISVHLNYKPACLGKQHFLTVKLSDPDLST